MGGIPAFVASDVLDTAYVFGVGGLSLVSADVSACLLDASFQSCSWGVLCFLVFHL